jgi:aminopeptidase
VSGMQAAAGRPDASDAPASGGGRSGSDGPDPGAFAALLCDYCLEVRPGQQVLVRSTTLAAPLLRALHRALLEREAWPLLRVELPGIEEDFYAHARDAQLDGIASVARAETERADAFLAIQAPVNTRALADVDPARIARAVRARAPLTELRMAKRWCGTLWPTPAGAQQAGMSETAFAAFVRRALFLDRPDPAAAWGELRAMQAELIARLSGARELRIEAEGTDLTLRVEGREWINSDGRRNMPSGEVFTGPHETSANGTIRFTVPSSPAGVEVEDVSLTFRDGEVVDAQASRGQAYLERMLATDPGARRLGEIGIGTNRGIDRPIGAILFDEKIGGTVHLALGRSYAETGAVNESAVHWDLICDLRRGGRLTADGVVVQEDGTVV